MTEHKKDGELGLEDYPYELPKGWEGVDVSGNHLIYENEEEEYAIELMQYEDKWRLSTSEPNPMRGGMMDVVDHWSYGLDELDDAFCKIQDLMDGDIE